MVMKALPHSIYCRRYFSLLALQITFQHSVEELSLNRFLIAFEAAVPLLIITLILQQLTLNLSYQIGIRIPSEQEHWD